MSCSSCGTFGSWFGGCCPSCQPASIAIRGECTDPGVLTSIRFVSGLDPQFCEGRLQTGTGVLNSVVNTSGNAQITWTDTPKLGSPEYATAATNTAFGNLYVLGADNRLRPLTPPNTASLVLQTNGSQELVFAAIPAATVPDPLNVNDLNVADQATIDKLETNSTVEMNNLSSGTAVNLLGLNATNQVILQSLSQGLSISMFFESPTSPNASAPNKNKVSGEYLIIGNRVFDSGADNIAVSTSESLTVQDAGTYLVFWSAQFRAGVNTAAKFGAWLEINGTVVNYGNGRTDGQVTGVNASGGQMYGCFGMDVRAYAANDVIKLLLNQVGTAQTLEVRLIAVRIP